MASEEQDTTFSFPTRRLITGHSSDGKAIFLADDVLHCTNPYADDMSPPSRPIPGFTLVHKTDGNPAKLNTEVIENHGKRLPLSDASGTVCRIVDFPPVGEDGDSFMHRTQSLDFGVILKGKIKLVLDDEVEKEMTEGDIVVQRGTIHAWKNVSNENCRVLFVLVPSDKVINNSTGKPLEETENVGTLHD